MWQIENLTPFAAERAVVRDREGVEVLVFAVKGTFTIDEDGATRPAEAMEPILFAPTYLGEPGRSSLQYDPDLHLGKGATDVIVHGLAHAARGEPATVVEVSLRVDAFVKRLLVIGDRTWEPAPGGVELSAPEPFVTMPIVYERAYGGEDEGASGPAIDARNPVGAGFARSPGSLAGRRAPNVEDPDAPIRAWSDRPAPMGFGPIAREWPARRKLAGSFDERWEEERSPLLPVDFDDRFHRAAPPDQQLPTLRGGEPVELVNMTPSGLLRFAVPRVRIGFRTRIAGKLVRHEGALGTLIIEPERSRIILVWRTELPCQDILYTWRRTKIVVEADAT
jgi:hypothetical protein